VKGKIVLSGLLILSIVILSVVGGCKSATPAKKTLTIGGIAFLTGPASQGGIACQRGWQLAVDKYNEAGGLKVGNDTYQINLIVEDDKMSADQASAADTKLIKQDGATIIVGPLIDALKTVVYPITSQNGVLMAIVDGLNCSVPYAHSADVAANKPLLMRVHWACNEISPYVLDYLVKQYPNVKKVAVNSVVEEASVVMVTGGKNDIDDQLAARGLQRVGEIEQFAPDITDFEPLMTRILSSKPDAILQVISTPVTFGLSVKAARALGFNGPMISLMHLDIDNQAALSGDPDISDMFGPGLTLADEPGMPQAVKDVKAQYLKKYPAKELISDVLLVGYNGMDVLLQTIQKARSVNPATILKTYEGLTKSGDLQTLWGPAYVGGKQTVGVNRVLNYPYMLDRVVNGKSTNFETVFVKVP